VSDFLKALDDHVVLGDGAFGTQIFVHGISLSNSFDELNLTRPDLIRSIHQSYRDAGAELIETNTFTANRLRLRKFQLEKKAREINLAGARLAREVAGNALFVAGSVGPLTGIKHEEKELSDDEKRAAFREQCEALAEGGCDALILETFTDLDELNVAFQAARATRLPVICQMAFLDKAKTPLGISVEQALHELEATDVIGANCTAPHATVKVLERMAGSSKARLSAFPNAGLPEVVDGRFMYLTTPAYFADTARKLAGLGVNLIGGCCGTGPDHIRAAAVALMGVPIARRKPLEAKIEEQPRERLVVASKPFNERIGREKLVVVELDPPRGIDTGKILRGARRLVKAGCDAITVGDNPLAIMRLGNVGMAHLLESEGIPTITHLSCRDKNLIALQSTILEAAALGITSLLPITGDPARVGDQPQATSVYDLNSFDLIKLIALMNCGKSWSGHDIGGQTRFSIGCAFNPNVRDLDAQVRRLKKKVAAGAHYALPQPLYDVQKIPRMYESISRELGSFPVFFGLLPPVSARNAEFLAHEVPGITIPRAVIDRIKAAPEAGQRREGIAIAKELIEVAFDLAPGFYIVPPFGSIEIAEELVQFVKKLSGKKAFL
jgi:homocysteine S-methyltransferase